MGGIATGKTTVRKQYYSSGYVLIDAADIFLSLSHGKFLPFPGELETPMELIGRQVAHRAVEERRHVVTEIVGANEEQMHELMSALSSAGYKLQVSAITCDLEEAARRNAARDIENDVSAYHAERFQIAWIADACKELDGDETNRVEGRVTLANMIIL